MNRYERAIVEKINNWQKFYAEVFHLNHDFGILRLTTLQIPTRPEYLCELIIEYGDLTLTQVFAKCKEKFNVECDIDINNVIDIAPWTTGDCVYWLQEYDLCDEEHEPEYYSDLEIASLKLVGMTFKGKLLHELYNHRHNRLCAWDTEDYTECWGSRLPDGGVPTVVYREEWGCSCSESGETIPEPKNDYNYLAIRATTQEDSHLFHKVTL